LVNIACRPRQVLKINSNLSAQNAASQQFLLVMYIQSLERFRVGPSLLSFVFRSFFPVLFGAVFVAALSPLVFAQSIEARPVSAILPSAPAYTRPRRAGSVNENAGPSSFSSLAAEANDIERRAFEQTNLAREQNGLCRLEWDSDLHRMARLHSESMARLGFFSHVTPEGWLLRDRARAAGIQQFNMLGENIAYNLGYDDPGGFAVERWLSSPGHRANVLATGFKAMAVGTFVAQDGSVYLTQVFISR